MLCTRFSEETFSRFDIRRLSRCRPQRYARVMELHNQVMAVESAPTLCGVQKLPPVLQAKAHDGEFYAGTDPVTPQLGDLRVTFSVVPPRTVSTASQQTGSSFQPYQTKAGKPIEMLQAGTDAAAEMFEQAQSGNKTLTWILRLVAFLLMFVGLCAVFKPISVLGDVVPFFGDLLGAGLGLVALLIALPLSFTTMVVVLLLCSVSYANELDGKWAWRLDKKLDGALSEADETTEVALRAVGSNLIGVRDSNIYSGEIVDGDTKLVVFQEIREGYTAVHAGVLVSVGGKWRIIGTWFDTKGDAGDFEMVKK